MSTWIVVTRLLSGAEYEYVVNLDRVESIIPEYSQGHCRITFSDSAFDVKESYQEIYELAPKGLLPEFSERGED